MCDVTAWMKSWPPCQADRQTNKDGWTDRRQTYEQMNRQRDRDGWTGRRQTYEQMNRQRNRKPGKMLAVC